MCGDESHEPGKGGCSEAGDGQDEPRLAWGGGTVHQKAKGCGEEGREGESYQDAVQRERCGMVGRCQCADQEEGEDEPEALYRALPDVAKHDGGESASHGESCP